MNVRNMQKSSDKSLNDHTYAKIKKHKFRTVAWDSRGSGH